MKISDIEIKFCDKEGRHYIKNGKHHRDDDPAFYGVSGERKWFQEGKLDRRDGKCASYQEGDEDNGEFWINGHQRWKNGKKDFSDLDFVLEECAKMGIKF